MADSAAIVIAFARAVSVGTFGPLHPAGDRVNAHDHSVKRGGVWRILLLLAAVVMSGDVHSNAPDSSKVVAEIPGPDGGWDYASFDPTEHRVLVSRSYGVMAIDADNGKVSKLADGERVHASFMLPNGELLITN